LEISCVSGDFNVGGGLLYGGGSFCVGEDSILLIDRVSRQLVKLPFGGEHSIALTSSSGSYASPVISPDSRSALFLGSDGEQDAIYFASLINDLDPVLLFSQADFYNYPRWHPQGNQIAWISWDHPFMPWDSSSLWLGSADIKPGEEPRLRAETHIAGGEGISVLQPEFSPDGRWLAYISDQSGWWQIHLHDLHSGKSRQLTNTPAEHALPPWLQNRNAYGFSPDSLRIFFLRNQDGSRSLWSTELSNGQETRIDLGEKYTWVDWFSISPTEERIAMVASAGDIPPRLISVDPSGEVEVIRRSNQQDLPRELFSTPKPISWPGSDDKPVRGLFYPPHNPSFQSDSAPPLLMIIHSGPTRQKFAEFSPRTQFFTSRGFAVLEVNYRGSSGYGREYRQSLQGKWGELDVEDCTLGAKMVSREDWADREMMALLGSSSGGLTVYQILVRYPGVFKAGIVLYGIVNHLDLLDDPPKFERHYSDWLIGPYPESSNLYQERSPIFFADRIQDPVAIFQGGKDPIVPRDQADQIVQALEENGISHMYTLYPDEGHGFKAAETIEDFYKRSVEFLNHYCLA
jgi:dipeptidyl aminopeptidase/acylaminoacyl peptidase